MDYEFVFNIKYNKLTFLRNKSIKKLLENQEYYENFKYIFFLFTSQLFKINFCMCRI